MAKFAPTCPPEVLFGLQRYGSLGDYHLVLAHDVVAKEKEYTELFGSRPAHSPMTVILDNSVVELGNAVDLEMIVKAAQIVRPTTTVLPDVMLHTDETILACKKALGEWPLAFEYAGLEPNFLIIPQGTNLQDWVKCAEAFANDPFINFWGIPRNAVGTEIRSRRDITKLAYALNGDRSIHLFGFSNCLEDDILTAQDPLVDGIDSAVPLRAVSLGVPRTIAGYNNMPKRGDWWDTVKFDYEMVEAVHTMRDWFSR